MKYPILPLFTVFFFISSCAQEPSNSHDGSFDSETYQSSGNENQNQSNASYAVSNTEANPNTQMPTSASEFIWHKVKDQKTGMTSSKIPMPVTWKVRIPTKEDDSNMTGPSGFKAYSYPGQQYMFTQDQFMAQSYSQAGVQMRVPMDIATLVEQELVPVLQKEGVQLISKYKLPALAAADRNYNSQLYGFQNFQSGYDAYVCEWKDMDGNPSMSIFRYYNQTSMGMSFWGYSINAMEADPSYYEQAKKEFVNALVNTKYNPAQIAQFNAREKAKEQQSWSQHNQRMGNNQRNFDASQQAYRTRQQASDIQMQGWQNTQNMQDQGHSNYINSVNETQVVTDYNNGQTYQVDAGANQTWMNGNGESIQTNDYLYNPNLDPNANQYNWENTDDDWDD